MLVAEGQLKMFKWFVKWNLAGAHWIDSLGHRVAAVRYNDELSPLDVVTLHLFALLRVVLVSSPILFLHPSSQP